MLTDRWPLRSLRLTTERLVLRQPAEAELAALADLAAVGVHEPGERPFLTPWTDLAPAERAQYVLQQHWSRLGSWTPDNWALELAVLRDDQPLGLARRRSRASSAIAPTASLATCCTDRS